MNQKAEEENVRIDKWLWAARFFKTRSLAAEAVSGGKVHLNGQRVKSSRAVKLGDELKIHRGTEEFTVFVSGLASRRGPASVAQGLYTETEESREKREERALQNRLLAQSIQAPPKRPSKRDRRHIIRFTRKTDV